jgi:hypothetical protein
VQEKRIRCRVVGVNYAAHHQGDEIEVTERELRRVGPYVLISLAEERKRIAE